MRPRFSALAFISILACLLFATSGVFFGQTAGGTRGSPGRPPTRGPESGLRIGKGPTTRPGSHETSVKDERDRIAGKFPAPTEKDKGEEERRDAAAAASTAYVDAVAIEAQRQAVTLTRDDFRVLVDGGPRRVRAVHYVFRGPQALAAGRAIAVGNGVIAHADEARTIVLAVDETTVAAGAERTVVPAIGHVLEVVGPADRAAVLTLPRPGPLRFAATHADLLASANTVVGRAGPVHGLSATSLDGLRDLLKDLAKLEGPKSVILFVADVSAIRRVSTKTDTDAAAISAILDAAAASRTALHLVVASQSGAPAPGNTNLQTLARSTGGSVTHLTGDALDLAPLATALLGGYVLDVEGRASDRDGTVHALSVSATTRGVRILAPTRWMPRFDPLPAPVMPASGSVKGASK